MKVALDVSAVPEQLAGAGRYVAELARRLPGAGVDVTLVSRRDDAARWSAWSPEAEVAALVPNRRALRLAYEAWRLGTSAAAHAADVWHAPHYTMPRRGKRPTVVTIHDLTFFTNPEWHERSKVAFFRRSIRYSVTHADVLITVSDFTARQIDELFAHHAPVVVAPHGVDLERFNADATDDDELLGRHGLSFGVPFVLFVGTLEPRKGLDVLLEAFAEIAAEDRVIELWLAGQAGWGMSHFEESLTRHPAAARIRRLGFVDDEVLPALFRHSRVVVYPSRGEGFGLPVLEAMACGALLVTTSDSVMAEVAGRNAQLVEAGNATRLAGAMTYSLSVTDDLRVELGGFARRRAEHFTWEASIAQHLSAYDLAASS